LSAESLLDLKELLILFSIIEKSLVVCHNFIRMTREKIKILLEIVDRKISELNRVAEQTLQSALEISKISASSPSTSGDREHAVNQAILNKEALDRLRSFREEVCEALSQSPPHIVQPICFVSLRYKDGQMDHFYFVNKATYLGEVKTISLASTLGKAILNKAVGDRFEYKIKAGNRKERKSGEIISVD
jgi:transcription elongation GreA/GreB family factor